MLVVEDFQKFAGIPCGISRIFESLMPQQICANRRKNRSIQVKPINDKRFMFSYHYCYFFHRFDS